MLLSFLYLKSDFRSSSLSFVRLSWSKITNKLAINCQNFGQVRLPPIKFAFKIRPFITLQQKSPIGDNLYI